MLPEVVRSVHDIVGQLPDNAMIFPGVRAQRPAVAESALSWYGTGTTWPVSNAWRKPGDPALAMHPYSTSGATTCCGVEHGYADMSAFAAQYRHRLLVWSVYLSP